MVEKQAVELMDTGLCPACRAGIGTQQCPAPPAGPPRHVGIDLT